MTLKRRIVVTRFGGSDDSDVDDNQEYSQLELAELIEDARVQVAYFVDVFDAHSKQTDKGRLVEHLLDANAIIHAFTRAMRAIRKLPLVVRNHPTAMVAIMSFEQAALDISSPRAITLQELLVSAGDLFQPGDVISAFTADRWHSVRRQLEIAASDISASASRTHSVPEVQEARLSGGTLNGVPQDPAAIREIQANCKMRISYSDGVPRGRFVRLWQIDGIGSRNWVVHDDDRRIQTLIHSNESWMLLDRFKKPALTGEASRDSLFDPDSGPTVLRPSEALRQFKGMQFAPPPDLIEAVRKEVDGVLPGWSGPMTPLRDLARQMLIDFCVSDENAAGARDGVTRLDLAHPDKSKKKSAARRELVESTVAKLRARTDEWIPRRHLKELGLAPTTVDADIRSHGKDGDSKGGGPFLDDRYYRREYLIEFASSRWSPRPRTSQPSASPMYETIRESYIESEDSDEATQSA